MMDLSHFSFVCVCVCDKVYFPVHLEVEEQQKALWCWVTSWLAHRRAMAKASQHSESSESLSPGDEDGSSGAGFGFVFFFLLFIYYCCCCFSHERCNTLSSWAIHRHYMNRHCISKQSLRSWNTAVTDWDETSRKQHGFTEECGICMW